MKIAPILRELRGRASFRYRLIHTGQHYDEDMSGVFFQQLRIPPPDISLGVGSGPHGAQTARILSAFEELLLSRESRPIGVVVVGDVNSTLAAALASVKLGIRVAHVESGLRSFDRTMPEEINRVVTDAIADVHLVTEESGRRNLLREGIDSRRIFMVGNVMIDTLVAELPAARELQVCARFGLKPNGYAVVTLHRPSNVDSVNTLVPLLERLVSVSRRLPVVFPTHPRTQERLQKFGLLDMLRDAAIVQTPPLGYHETLSLLSSAQVVLTDSGGVQEETSVLRIPCLTLRPNTERVVTVDIGTNTLIADDLSRIDAIIDDVLAGRYKTGGEIPLWDGRASGRILDVLTTVWN